MVRQVEEANYLTVRRSVSAMEHDIEIRMLLFHKDAKKACKRSTSCFLGHGNDMVSQLHKWACLPNRAPGMHDHTGHARVV